MSLLGEIARAGSALSWLSPKERSILARIGDCGTGRLGLNTMGCSCGHRETHYNSCRDRHCPLCQGAARARWVRERLSELLPCPYYHVVFTLPHELRSIVHANKAIVYRELFRCVHDTLLEVGARTENLGARLGGMSILHTWNQKLAYHPHLHCIVPGGGPSHDGSRWVASKSAFLLPVRRLSAVFRGKFLSCLEALHRKGKLYSHDLSGINFLLRKAASKDFVVYAKRPFGSPAQVVKYLGRYTHRVGISEGRIRDFVGGMVRCAWIDRKHGNCSKLLSLTLEAFLKKFLSHLLPRGIKKIRYFGYFANRDRQENIAAARKLLESSGHAQGACEPCAPEPAVLPCPRCGKGLVLIAADGWRSCPNTLKRRLILHQYMKAREEFKTVAAETG